MKQKQQQAVAFAILAALLYGAGSPAAKLLLGQMPPLRMAALLYLGAGAGMLLLSLLQHRGNSKAVEARLTRQELPYIIGMIVLDIAAPIFLMLGLTRTTAANAALLGNFEIVATAVTALVLFHEAIGKRLWLALGLITFASALLSFEDMGSFSFSAGSALVLLACICWGFENNCTRMLSLKSPMEIVVVKGFGSGFGSLLLSLAVGERSPGITYVLPALLLGFAAYGLSIFFYVTAQRELGAARTGAYYAAAPFIGVGLSFALFAQAPTVSFVAAFAIMSAGAYFAITEQHNHLHVHAEMVHEHRHSHDDGHHNHTHDDAVVGEHSHEHSHEALTHRHGHTPDLHHTHRH